MEGLGALIGLVLVMMFPLAAVAVGLGWIVLLVMGIVRMRRGEDGRRLAIGGAAWGVVALLLGIWLTTSAVSFFRGLQAEPFVAEEYAGQTGVVEVTWDGPCEVTVMAQADEKRWLLTGENGRLIGPAGEHAVSEWVLKADDAQGRTWTATGRPWGASDSSRVTIDPDQPARLAVGPPLRGIADVTPEADDEVSIDLSIVGSQGGSYTIGREDGLAPPGFEVLDASGAVVWSGDFEYG